MAHLADLDPADEGQPLYVLAQRLRELIPMTGAKSSAEYARKFYVDPGTVSKALKGKEIPTREFVGTLAKNATMASGVPHLLPEYLSVLEDLYDKAIADSPKRKHMKERLTDEIAKRDAVVEALTAALCELGEQLKDLTSSARAMQNGKVLPLNNASEPGFFRQGVEIDKMQDFIRGNMNELSEVLAWNRQRLAEAEGLAESFEALVRGERLAYPGADDETELLNLDGLRMANAASHMVPVEYVDAMRSELSELEEKVLQLEQRLKMRDDEVEYLRGRSQWHPPAGGPRHRRQANKPESLFSEDDLLIPPTERRWDSLG